MRILAVRCSNTDFAYAVIEGTSHPHKRGHSSEEIVGNEPLLRSSIRMRGGSASSSRAHRQTDGK